MKITRNNQEIEITEAELEEAYREKQFKYLVEDAKRQLLILSDYDGNDEPEEDDCEAQEFKKWYGVSLIELLDDECFLASCVEQYENNIDCNMPENLLWEITIKDRLREYKNASFTKTGAIKAIVKVALAGCIQDIEGDKSAIADAYACAGEDRPKIISYKIAYDGSVNIHIGNDVYRMTIKKLTD